MTHLKITGSGLILSSCHLCLAVRDVWNVSRTERNPASLFLEGGKQEQTAYQIGLLTTAAEGNAIGGGGRQRRNEQRGKEGRTHIEAGRSGR